VFEAVEARCLETVVENGVTNSQLACFHDQNKSGFFGGPTFIQPIKAI